jgi:hypothetical protein
MQYPQRARIPEVLLGKAVILLITFITLLSSVKPTSAASTYYLATNGSDLSSGTSSAPWRNFSKAWSMMAPGDTLIVKNGRYQQQIKPTVSGTPGNPITIKAETDGGAILDGQGVRSGIEIFSNPPTTPTRQYITIEGFRVENSGERPAVQVASQDGTPLSGQSNNIVIRRTAARGDVMSSNNAVWIIARARDSLLEDIWGWRYGRYVINVYGCTRVTVRRGVFRWDGWGQGAGSPGDPKFNMGVYDTHDSLIENVILLDAADDPLGGDKGGLYVPGNANGTTAPYGDSDNNTFKGVLSLNNIGVGVGVEGGSGGTNDNNRFVDLVSWGNSYVGVTVPSKASGTSFDHVTVGANSTGFYFGNSSKTVSGTVLKNSLVYLNSGYGINGPASTSYNNVYANGTSYNGGASAGTNTTSQDPLLDYIVRIEAASICKGTASDGGDRGAAIVKRYVDGMLTGEDLWPWPNEDRIHADLCESVTRGLCDPSWESLTDYVWRQLGNPWPGGTAPPPPPPPPPPNQVFQQGRDGYAGVTDTWINSYDPNLNFNGETKLSVYGYEDIKTLVRFDLSSIPPGTTITSATLSLYNYAHANSANGGTLSVYPVTKTWVESEATWNRRSTSSTWTAAGMQSGTDYATSPSTSITIDTATGVWRSFDVTAIVRGWLNGTIPNNGFVVRSPTNGVKPLFYSSGYTTDPSVRPKLTIND